MSLEDYRYVDGEGLAHKLALVDGHAVIVCSKQDLEGLLGDHGLRHERGLKSYELVFVLVTKGAVEDCTVCEQL